MSNAQGSPAYAARSIGPRPAWSDGTTSTIESAASGTTSTSGPSGSSTKSGVVMIRSTSPTRSAGMLSCGSSSSSSTSMCGWVRARAVTAGTARVWIALWNAPTRTSPAGSSPSPRSSPSTVSMWSRIALARRASISPAGVSRTRRPVRSSSWVRVSASRTASCWDTVDALRLAASATARTVPRISSWLSSRSRQGLSMGPLLCGSAEQHTRNREMDVSLGPT